MNTKVLLAGTAVLALAASGAIAGSRSGTIARTVNVHPISSIRALYSQNSDFQTYSIVSQNFTSGSFGTADNAAAADDFVVPAGKVWVITGLDVTGRYADGSGPATSEVVTFYKNNAGRPGTAIGTSQTLHCTDSSGSFSCSLSRVRLGGGNKGKAYWVSIVANCNFYGGCGEWQWTQTITHHNPGQWQNPGGGWDTTCSSWGDTSTCLGEPFDDFAFDLSGRG